MGSVEIYALLYQCRTLADEVDDLEKVSFKLPPDAQKPAADAQRTQSAAMAYSQELPAQRGALKTGVRQRTSMGGAIQSLNMHWHRSKPMHASRTLACFLTS